MDLASLSLGVNLRSILQDAMHQYPSYSLVQINEWENLDILDRDTSSVGTINLFKSMLSQLPSLPFEELLLHRVEIPDIKELPIGVMVNCLIQVEWRMH